MQPYEQYEVDEKTKKSIDSAKSYFSQKLDEETIKTLHSLFAPYLKEDEYPKGYDDINEFYSDMGYVSYYVVHAEKEARDEEFRNMVNDMSECCEECDEIEDAEMI
jgi:hypothetical protein